MWIVLKQVKRKDEERRHRGLLMIRFAVEVECAVQTLLTKVRVLEFMVVSEHL